MNIRNAEPADAARIRALHMASIRELCSETYSASEIKAWTEHLAEVRYADLMSRHRFLAAEGDDGAILGFCIFGTSPSVVFALYVDPAASRRGVGKALLAAAEHAMSAASAIDVTLQSTINAVPFYERAGFVVTRRSFHALPSGEQLDCFEMIKRLPRGAA